METLRFKTNIKCAGCIATVTPKLNEKVGGGNWDVDIENPDKILTVRLDDVNESDVITAVEDAGFKAQKL